ncbi:MAG: fibronectin type III domain-containing protein, partial [Ruminococcus sp.]|nr:fibronectin type III domain-containing protein [Ruminococcus sp.]
MKKRIFSLFTSLTMVISMVAVLPAITAGALVYESFEYLIGDDGNVVITDFIGGATTINIPSEIDGHPVVSIGDEAFEDVYVDTVIVGDNIVWIGAGAFCDSEVREVKFSKNSNLVYIGVDAFYSCDNLRKINFPSTLLAIDEYAFFDTAISSISLPSGLLAVGTLAFGNCYNLKSITIPRNIEEIQQFAFGYVYSYSDSEYTYYEPINNFKISCYLNTPGHDYAVNEGFSYTIANPTFKVAGLNVSSQTTNSVKLSWDKIASANGYIVYISNDGVDNWRKIGVITSNVNTFTATGLDAGRTYRFAVKSYKTINKKNITSSTYPTILTTTLPANITKASFTSSQNSVKMSWSRVSGATGYRVYQYNNSTKKWGAVANTTSTVYMFNSLKAGTTYKFTVRPYRTLNGKNYFSQGYSTFTTSTSPANITKVTLTPAETSVKMSWSKVPGATGYRVYQYNNSTKKWG